MTASLPEIEVEECKPPLGLNPPYFGDDVCRTPLLRGICGTAGASIASTRCHSVMNGK